MLGALFGHARAKAFSLAQEVDRAGRAIVWTSHREAAELKQEQIHAYGSDPRIAHCRGSMSAVLESSPA
jgi:ATP-dependent Clp protease adaptor protein ClpS